MGKIELYEYITDLYYSVGYYCELFGKSRQAYYEQRKTEVGGDFTEAIVLKLVSEIRKDLPKCGLDKLHYMLKQSFIDNQIKMGNDGLYQLLGTYGLFVNIKKNYSGNSSC